MSAQVNTQEKTGLLFLTGAGLRSSIWSKVADNLDYPHLMATYPRRNDSTETRESLTLNDYVNHIKRQTDEWGHQTFVIVAHSLGGVIGLRLASVLSNRLAGFIAVGAAIPKKGGSFVSALPFPKRVLIASILRMKVYTDPTQVNPPTVPKLYIKLTNDKEFSPSFQDKMISNLSPQSVRTLNTGHLPMLSDPDGLKAVIEQFMINVR